MCKSLRVLCPLVIFVFIAFNLLSPVYATEATVESEQLFDYELDFGRKYTVVEELLDKVTYEVCCCDVLKEAELTAQGYPHSFSIDSVDALTQYMETAGGGDALDFTVRTERYPNSFLDITAKYDDAFFAENFLAIVQMPMREGDTFTIERIDHVSGNGNTICVVTDFEEYKSDRKVYYAIIPLSRSYYGGPQSVTASHVDRVTFAEESPKPAVPGYTLYGQFDCYVQTELKDINYTVCCADVIHPMGLGGIFPVVGTDTSVEDVADWFDMEEEFAWPKMYDLDTKTDMYPISFREAMSRYDDAFFAENFLMVAFASSTENAVVSPQRLDVVDYAGSEKLLMIFDLPEQHEYEWVYEKEKMYFVIAEVPLEYYHERDNIKAVTAHFVDRLEPPCLYEYNRLIHKVEDPIREYQLKTCYGEVISDASLADNFPAKYTITSREQALQLIDHEFEGKPVYDRDSKNEMYPQSYREIMESYDDSFFDKKFLYVLFWPEAREEPVSLSRFDVTSVFYDGATVGNYATLILDIDRTDTSREDMKFYYAILEVPKVYYRYIEENKWHTYMLDDVTFLEGAPQTADSFALLPAAAAMAFAAAGLVWVRKRRTK